MTSALATRVSQSAPVELGQAPGRSARSLVRPLEERDLEFVARLFLARFRKRSAPKDSRARDDLVSYMRQLYLKGPDGAAGTASLIQIDSHGDVGAFIGVIPMTFQLNGDPLKVGISGALMASESANSLAAIQLLRELHRQRLDMIFTDSANASSMAIGAAMKYKTLPSGGLEWAHIFQPAAVVLHKLAGRMPGIAQSLLRPFAAAADFVAVPALNKRFPRSRASAWTDAPIGETEFVDIAPRFLEDTPLRPTWSPPELNWLVKQAALRRSAGPLNFRIVRAASGEAVGCYAFYGERGGVARVIHTGAARNGWSALLAKVLETTEAMGCIGVHGAARKDLLPLVHPFPGMFLYNAGGVMIFSHRADVAECIAKDELFVGGLAGDRWTRLATDRFGLLPPRYA